MSPDPVVTPFSPAAARELAERLANFRELSNGTVMVTTSIVDDVRHSLLAAAERVERVENENQQLRGTQSAAWHLINEIFLFFQDAYDDQFQWPKWIDKADKWLQRTRVSEDWCCDRCKLERLVAASSEPEGDADV